MEIQRARLKAYLEAERAILEGAQSYQIGDRALTRADLRYIQNVIADLITELNTTAGRPGMTKRTVFIE